MIHLEHMTRVERGRAGAAFLWCVAAIVALVLFLASASCATWQQTAKTVLVGAETTVDGASKVGLDYYRRRCRDVAQACPAGTTDKTCAPLGRCWTARRLLQTVLDKAALAISATWSVLVAADQKGTTTGILAVQAALSDLAQLLSGIVPGGVL